MIIDGRQVDDQTVIATEVCVVGAGPAGMTIAHEMLGCGIATIVLESGDFEHSKEAHALNRSQTVDTRDMYPNPGWSRSRRVGGTSDQWDVPVEGQFHAHIRPFERSDFEKRDWLPHSGWPISFDDLEPWYRRAQKFCSPTAYDYAPAHWETEWRHPIEFPSGRIDTRMLTTAPQSLFQKDIPGRMRASERVSLYTNSTAYELVATDNGGSVTEVSVGTLSGRRFRIRAKHVILAQGGFEVARLLLASRGQVSCGLGNQNDLVGRFMMDRMLVKTGTLIPPTRSDMRRFSFYDSRDIDHSLVIGKFVISEETRARERILCNATSMAPMPKRSLGQTINRMYGRETTYRSDAFRSSRVLFRAVRDRKLPPKLLSHAWNVLRDLDDLMYVKVLRTPGFQTEFNRDAGGWAVVPNLEERFASLEFNTLVEQAPDPDNRIALTEELDPFGTPVLVMKNRLNDIDLRSALVTQRIFAEELQAAGLGTLKSELRNGEPCYFAMSTHHPAGTTRMSADPKAGVVDANCRVHGMDNLHVASSSVFPTGGCFPPTLTILAVAMRVADQVRRTLRGEVPGNESVHHVAHESTNARFTFAVGGR